MKNNERSLHPLAGSGLALAPIHASDNGAPLRICVLARLEPDPAVGRHVLLRELPGSRVFLGAVCDAEARIQEWVEIWVQTVEFHDLAFSSYQERLANHTFDQRWRAEYELSLANLPELVIVTGMETQNPRPVLIKRNSGQTAPSDGPISFKTYCSSLYANHT